MHGTRFPDFNKIQKADFSNFFTFHSLDYLAIARHGAAGDRCTAGFRSRLWPLWVNCDRGGRSRL